MSRPLWFVQLLKMTFPGRFLLARVTRVPLVGRIVDRWLFDKDDLFYLPPDRLVAGRQGSSQPPCGTDPPRAEEGQSSERAPRTIPVGRTVEPSADVVLPSQIVKHFIEQASVHWIMDTCICRDASGCKDYPIDLGCLFLGEAAAGINPRLGRRVAKEEALAHVRRCREAGLVHLIGRNKLDTVWLGVGPGDRLLTICHCCPCCCLWRVLPHVSERIGDRVTRMDGVTVRVSERCAGCGTCADGVCFVDAIHLEDHPKVTGLCRAVIGDACRGCGRCLDVCPQGAIEMAVEHSQFVAEAIARISPLVDVG